MSPHLLNHSMREAHHHVVRTLKQTVERSAGGGAEASCQWPMGPASWDSRPRSGSFNPGKPPVWYSPRQYLDYNGIRDHESETPSNPTINSCFTETEKQEFLKSPNLGIISYASINNYYYVLGTWEWLIWGVLVQEVPSRLQSKCWPVLQLFKGQTRSEGYVLEVAYSHDW